MVKLIPKIYQLLENVRNKLFKKLSGARRFWLLGDLNLCLGPFYFSLRQFCAFNVIFISPLQTSCGFPKYSHMLLKVRIYPEKSPCKFMECVLTNFRGRGQSVSMQWIDGVNMSCTKLLLVCYNFLFYDNFFLSTNTVNNVGKQSLNSQRSGGAVYHFQELEAAHNYMHWAFIGLTTL